MFKTVSFLNFDSLCIFECQINTDTFVPVSSASYVKYAREIIDNAKVPFALAKQTAKQTCLFVQSHTKAYCFCNAIIITWLCANYMDFFCYFFTHTHTHTQIDANLSSSSANNPLAICISFRQFLQWNGFLRYANISFSQSSQRLNPMAKVLISAPCTRYDGKIKQKPDEIEFDRL